MSNVTKNSITEALKSIGHSVFNKSTDGHIQGIRDHNGTVTPFELRSDRIEIRTSHSDNYCMCVHFDGAELVVDETSVCVGTNSQFVQFYHFKH